MSGGLRTSVKGYLIAQRVTGALEINTVHENENENETSINVASNSTAADSVDHPPPLPVPETSASYGLNICDGNIPCFSMLSSAAECMASYGTTTGAECPPHAVPSTPRTEGEILLFPTLKTFSFSELKRSTRQFRFDNMLGEGSFGCVFKGWVNGNSLTAAKPGTGMVIAVKRLNRQSLLGHKEWMTEINYLGRLRHPNLVKLIGYCTEDDDGLLVYEFMPCGSLNNHLFRRGSYSQSLSWTLRMKIAFGAAKVLAFLHSGEVKVIHRNIKSSKILLDSTYNAKLCSFCLAKDGPEGDRSHISTRVMGTSGHAAPEYVATGHLTAKCDVYAFGVVMLEMLSGKRAMDKNSPTGESNLVEWSQWTNSDIVSKHKVLQIIDARVEGQYSVATALKAADLAFRCLSTDPKLRPNMNDVVKVLEELQESGDMSHNEPRHNPHASSSN
ncbi:putative transferase, protein kinase RLK-Pelle-RLCK-VIIa-2 family [Rosa chinensis]|uniref:non-specific serine/threonine protein kinase n=1 Tax=Rosa chinensis TaxID=74649 RepID=A0A2P6SKH2_ROSCH|nr:receptor-like cytoplasmic kinase 176 isoform X2 [Rosa chinensis]PRQ59171.1 putative transferase, protein kinase RLK-Pelle-RLCK-VIIa-2 family [Rosa chinensis]